MGANKIKKLHIALIIPHTDLNIKYGFRQIGGAERQASKLINAFSHRDDVYISLLTRHTNIRPIKNKVSIYMIKGNWYLFIIKSCLNLIIINREKRIDIIYPHMLGISMIPALIAKIFLHKKIFVKISGDISQYRRAITPTAWYGINNFISMLFEIYFKIIIKSTDYFQVLNLQCKKDLLKQYKVQKWRIVQIPNGIDIPNIEISKNSALISNFGFVGRLEHFKCIPLLLRTFHKFAKKNPDKKLLLFGKGTLEKYIENYIQENKLEKKIIRMGFEKDIKKIYSSFDCMVMTSLGEGMNNSILEAMAYEKPIIASRVSGITDLIKEPQNGLLFDNKKPAELYSRLEQIVKDQNLANSLRIAARKTVEEKYKIETVCERILKTFRFIVSDF